MRDFLLAAGPVLPPPEDLPSSQAILIACHAFAAMLPGKGLPFVGLAHSNSKMTSEYFRPAADCDHRRGCSPRAMFSDESIATAALPLSDVQRHEILRSMSVKGFDAESVVCELIGTDVTLYREFLADPEQSSLHLAPLRGTPNANWAELAATALDRGFSPRELVTVAFREPHVFRGPIHESYIERAERWKQLAHHPDPRLQEIARIGIEQCLASAEGWRKRDETDEFLESYA